MKNTSRHRCVICGKLRKDDFLDRINDNWICSVSIGYKPQNFIQVNGHTFSLHPCKKEYVKYLFYLAKKSIDLYNSSINDKDLIWFNEMLMEKKEIPEPTFFLQ